MVWQNRTDQRFLYHAWNDFISSWCRKVHENHAENSEVLSLTGKKANRMIHAKFRNTIPSYPLTIPNLVSVWSQELKIHQTPFNLQVSERYQLEKINSFLPLMPFAETTQCTECQKKMGSHFAARQNCTALLQSIKLLVITTGVVSCTP